MTSLSGGRKSSRRIGAQVVVRSVVCQAGWEVEGLINRISDITTGTRRLDEPCAILIPSVFGLRNVHSTEYVATAGMHSARCSSGSGRLGLAIPDRFANRG